MSNYGEQIDENTIQFKRILPGPIERIWSWIVEEDKRRQWLAAGEIELRQGGKVELLFNNRLLTTPDDKIPEKYKQYDGETRVVGEVLEIDPPRLIKFTWPEDDGTSSIETIALDEKGDAVVLTLTHEKAESFEAKVGVSAGWHAHLDIMAAKLAGDTPPKFWSHFSGLEAEYEGQLAR